MPRAATNEILDGLGSPLRSGLLEQMQPVDLPVGTILLKPGQSTEYAHFITSGIASVVTYMADGAGAEVGLIGKEGLVEALQLIGSAQSPTTAFVQVKATALRMRFAPPAKTGLQVGSASAPYPGIHSEIRLHPHAARGLQRAPRD